MYIIEIEIKFSIPVLTRMKKYFFTWDHNPTPNTDTSYPFEILSYPCCTDSKCIPVAITDSDGKQGRVLKKKNKWYGIVDLINTPVVPSVNTETYYLYTMHILINVYTQMESKNSQITLQNL